MISGKDVRVENGNLIINGGKNPIVQDVSDIEGDIEELETGKVDNLLSANSEKTLNVGDTFQIPSEMLDRTLIIVAFNRAAWCGSVSIPSTMIKVGDTANGLKVISGDKSNPTVDKYIIFDISTTGLITIDYINNWSEPFVKVRAI